jgi:exosortase A
VTRWQRHLGALALLSAAILAIFWRDAADMVGIWWHSSTFTHCLLMVPMIGWLVSQRAALLRPLTPVYWWPALLWMAGAGLVWLVGEAAGVGLFRQLGLVLMLQGAVVAALGEKLVRALLFPLAYALLLVPFGEELVPLLQTLTAHISMVLLHLSGIAAQMEGVFITTPAGFFEVAEACSGVNFLIAMLAYAVFAAHLCFRSWTRRIVFVALALATTILANALRAYGTMAAAEIWGIEAAGGIDHIFYGWIFFGLVILLVMLVAWRWFDRPANDAAVDVSALGGLPRFAGRAKAVLPPAFAIPLFFAGWAMLVGGRTAPLPDSMAVEAPTGWRDASAAGVAWAPRFDGADQRVLRHFVDENGHERDRRHRGLRTPGRGARGRRLWTGCGRSRQQVGVECFAARDRRCEDRAAVASRSGAARRGELVCCRWRGDGRPAPGKTSGAKGAIARRRPARAVADPIE